MSPVRLLDQELDEQPQVNEERIDRCDPQAHREGRVVHVPGQLRNHVQRMSDLLCPVLGQPGHLSPPEATRRRARQTRPVRQVPDPAGHPPAGLPVFPPGRLALVGILVGARVVRGYRLPSRDVVDAPVRADHVTVGRQRVAWPPPRRPPPGPRRNLHFRCSMARDLRLAGRPPSPLPADLACLPGLDGSSNPR